MAITTFAELQTAIGDWLERDDLDTATFIALAEATLNKVLRDPRMVTTDTLSIALNGTSDTLATDLLDIAYMQVASTPGSPLERVSPEELMNLRRYRFSATGTPAFYAIIGRTCEVAPVASALTSITCSYFQALPALATNSTNWLLTYDPDIYLYTSLLHAAPFIPDDRLLAVTANMVSQMVSQSIRRGAKLTAEEVAAGVPMLPQQAPQAAA